MEIIKRLSSFSLAVLLAVVMVLSPATVLAEEVTNENELQKQEAMDYTRLVQQAIDDASDYMVNAGVNSEWQAIGLAKAGKNIPATYIKQFNQNIKDQIINGLDTGRIKITDIERLSLAALAIGKDPFDIEGYNLIELIYNSPDHLSGSDTMTFQGINGPIFGLIALDAMSFDIPSDARWTREKLIKHLLDEQNDDGSWSLFGTAPSYDITAMALIALGKHTKDVDVQESIQKAATFLSESQSDHAGFNDPWNGGVSLESAAQVMIGLTTAGIDPLGPEFTKENGNLLDHILSFLAEDGGFKHLPDDAQSNGMATEQGFQALVAYQLYAKEEGRLYDFSKKETTPEPEVPTEPEEPKEPEIPEDNVPPVIIVNDEKVTINKEKEIIVKDHKTRVKLPNDFPEGTTLTTHILDEKDHSYKGIKAAGDIINFKFQYPDDKDTSTGNYHLSMGINGEADPNKTGIYYLNEATNEWQYVGGWGSAKDGIITIDVDHFSTYGVFTDVEGPTNLQMIKGKATPNSITLRLSAQDPSGIKEYIIYRDGQEIATIAGNEEEFHDSDLQQGKTYEYTVIAIDQLGNESTAISDFSTTAIEVDNAKENDAVIVDKPENKIDDNNHLVAENIGEQLPNTATNTFNILFIGIMLIVIGGVIYLIRRKTTTHQ